MDSAVINLFPFYVQGKSVKVFDNDGNRLLWITKTRAYIDLMGLLAGKIRIRKLWIYGPQLDISRKELEKVIQNITSYRTKGEKGKFSVTLKNIELSKGDMILNDVEGGQYFKGFGISFDLRSKRTLTANLIINEMMMKFPDLNEIKGNFKGGIRKEKDRIEISDLIVNSSNSSFNAEGYINLTSGGELEKGNLNTTAEIDAASVNELFGLKEKKEGLITLNGSVGLGPGKDSKWPVFSLDLNTDIHFYLETLMEILHVSPNIQGEVTGQGKITGTIPDIIGQGKAQLNDALFDRLPLDDVDGEISYSNMKFALKDFTSRTFDGSLAGKAHILIPSGTYSVTADISGINSPEFFEFIRWEAPFPEGKISGNFHLNHDHISSVEILADLEYQNSLSLQGNLLGRLESIRTALELKNDVLWLDNTLFLSAQSELFLEGTLDFNEQTMNLDLLLETGDVADLTAPDYTRFNAPARFHGKATGPINDPELNGDFEADSGTIHGIPFTKAVTGLKYKISRLNVEQMEIEHEGSKYNASGSIEFRQAKGLFTFNGPYYNANALLEQVDIKPFITASYKDLPVSGLVSGKLSFKGDHDDFISSGDLIIDQSELYGQKVERIEVKTMLDPEKIEFQSLKANEKQSVLEANGQLYFDKRFNVTITSSSLDTCDIQLVHDHPFSSYMSLNVNGSGTIDNPELEFSSNIFRSYWKEKNIGAGKISGNLRNKKLSADGVFMDGKISASARADISNTLKWDADIDIGKGRYDFLLAGLLKDAPDDLSVFLEGNVKLEAEGEKLLVRSQFGLAELYLYGYDFKNDKDIYIELRNKKLTLKSLSLKGKSSDLYASGTLEIGKDYDINLNGTMDIAPLKSFVPRMEELKGVSDFRVNIKGPWEKPEFMGELILQDAEGSLPDVPYKLGPINGTFEINRNRISFESVSAEFAGGKLVLTGVGYLKNFKLDKLYVTSTLNDIKIRPMEKVNALFDGRLFYETSKKGSILTGNLDIKKAKYGKKVEFDNVLFGLKEIKKRDVKYAAFLDKTELNIHVTGLDNILIDNNIARTPVNIALTVMGTIDQKGLVGRIEANEGEIYFRSNEFKILDGSSVEFIDPKAITPLFHIIAETYINDYYIKLTLDGTMDRFALSLFSDPPLPEEEILTLLTFGQVKKEVRGIESGLAATEAASILTGDIQDAVEDRFTNITGFERFKVEPHTTQTGAFGSKLTVGKRVLEDKLFVIYSTSIGTTEDHIIKLKYSLHKNVSLVGSRDEIGDTGVDLKYRFEFK